MRLRDFRHLLALQLRGNHRLHIFLILVAIFLRFEWRRQALDQLVRQFLLDVSATDPPTIVVVTILLAVVTLLACYVPAKRAMRVDPVVALRHE